MKKLSVLLVVLSTMFFVFSCGSKESVDEKVKSEPQAVETGTEDDQNVTETETESEETSSSSTRNSGYYGYSSVRSSVNEENEVKNEEESSAKADASDEAAKDNEDDQKKEGSLLENTYVRYGAIGGLAAIILLVVFFIFKPKP